MSTNDFSPDNLRRVLREALNLSGIPVTGESLRLLVDLLAPACRKMIYDCVTQGRVDAAKNRSQAWVVEHGGKLPPHMHITPSEHAVLCHLCQGLSIKETSDSLGMPVDTVRAHRGAIYRKWRVNDPMRTVVMALRMGVVTLDDLDDQGST